MSVGGVFVCIWMIVVIIVIHLHIFGLTVVQFAGTPITALGRTYPIDASLIPFGFHYSIIVR